MVKIILKKTALTLFYVYCSSQKLVSSLLEYSWTLNLYIALFQSKTLLFTPLLAASQIKYVPLQVRFSS